MLLDTSFTWFHYKFNKYLSTVTFNVPDILLICLFSTLFEFYDKNSHAKLFGFFYFSSSPWAHNYLEEL